ncbi:MAG: hypothetical protein EOP86_12075 [Verrucomicrobiaceae bacterium]|nr:MAG: hypothetical protein EOP86_12075 [Verrucomicrobiaceae bacterium]
MTKDFYSLLGCLQSLLYYLYKPGTGEPREFFEQLGNGTLAPVDRLLDQPFANVRQFYLLAAGSSRALALAVSDLRAASSALQQHPELQSAGRRALAAAAAGISLEDSGGNSWLAAATAYSANGVLPPQPDRVTVNDLLKFAEILRLTAVQGQRYETSLLNAALKAEELCSRFKSAGEDFYNSMQPLLVSIGEFDPELKRLLSEVQAEIKKSLGIDGSGDGSGTWPSGYVSSSSSSSSSSNGGTGG